MNELQLQPNESVLLQEDGVLCKGLSKSYSDELYLTNINLILVRNIKKGMFGKAKETDKFPLSQIKIINGEIQAKFINGELQIFLVNKQLAFAFYSGGKKRINAFIDGINSAIKGTPMNSSKASSAIPGTEIIAETFKDTIGTFKNAFGIKGKNVGITIKCIGCHAPITGVIGQKSKMLIL